MINLENSYQTFETLDYQRKKASIVLTDWFKKARDNQIVKESDQYNIHLFLAGRGWGKTLTGAYDIIQYCLINRGVICGVIAPTYGDLKRVVFSGDSGFMNIIDRDLLGGTGYNKSDSEITFYNGSKIIGFPAIEPDRLRGVQFHRAWCDELASWRYRESFDNLMMALRLGQNPKCIITTTPRPTKLIKELAQREDTQVIKGNTFDNMNNLAPSAIAMLKERYEGTRIGRQELYAEILEDLDGALWNNRLIEEARLSEDTERTLQKVIVAIDPAVTAKDDSDETGIVVVGKDFNNEYYVLEDLSGKHSADKWGRIAVNAYYEWEADRIVAEVNNGGDLVERLLRNIDPNVPYRSVHATRGKLVRAEPIAALYEQRRVHHMGMYPELEAQMCTYTGDTKISPDRLDALVWGLTELSKSKGDVNWSIS